MPLKTHQTSKIHGYGPCFMNHAVFRQGYTAVFVNLANNFIFESTSQMKILKKKICGLCPCKKELVQKTLFNYDINRLNQSKTHFQI